MEKELAAAEEELEAKREREEAPSSRSTIVTPGHSSSGSVRSTPRRLGF